MKLCAVVLAAGSGSRMKSTIPKQFMEIKGKPLIAHTLEKLESNRNIVGVVVVTNKEYVKYMGEIVKKYGYKKILNIVCGGITGIESTYFGIKSVNSEFDAVMIHDGNRPLIDDEIIDNAIKVYEIHGNAVSAIPTVELTYESTNGISSTKYINRDHIWKTHTPQIYNRDELLDIFEQARNEDHFLDYASTTEIFCSHNKQIYFSQGKTTNIKITYPEDYKLLIALLEAGV